MGLKQIEKRRKEDSVRTLKTHCRHGHEWTPENILYEPSRPNSRLCKACIKPRQHQYHKHNYLKQSYNVAPSFLDGKACAICGTTEFPGRGPHIDHDHECCPGKRSCGKCVRSVLCCNCNSGMGFFKDDVTKLEAAIDYINRYKERSN